MLQAIPEHFRAVLDTLGESMRHEMQHGTRNMGLSSKVMETNFNDSVLYGHNVRLYEAFIDREKPMNQRVKRQAIRSKRVAKAFVAGLGSLLSISAPHAGHYHPAPSAQAALRGDFARIGRDMYVAVERERQHEKASR